MAKKYEKSVLNSVTLKNGVKPHAYIAAKAGWAFAWSKENGWRNKPFTTAATMPYVRKHRIVYITGVG